VALVLGPLALVSALLLSACVFHDWSARKEARELLRERFLARGGGVASDIDSAAPSDRYVLSDRVYANTVVVDREPYQQWLTAGRLSYYLLERRPSPARPP
jgi:hypothetical protein